LEVLAACTRVSVLVLAACMRVFEEGLACRRVWEHCSWVSSLRRSSRRFGQAGRAGRAAGPSHGSACSASSLAPGPPGLGSG